MFLKTCCIKYILLICFVAYSGVGYQNGYRSEQGCCYGNHSSNQQGFCPIRTPSPTDSVHSVSPCDPEYENEYPGATELLVSNLDYNISPREWKHILLTTFHPHVKVGIIIYSLILNNLVRLVVRRIKKRLAVYPVICFYHTFT